MPQRILLIEPDTETRQRLRESLTAEGYHASCPVDSYGAIDEIEATQIDTIVMNDSMPIIDGQELIMHLMQIGRKIPAIILCDRSPHQVSQRYPEDHTHTFLRKPFHVKELLSCLETLIQTQ